MSESNQKAAAAVLSYGVIAAVVVVLIVPVLIIGTALAILATSKGTNGFLIRLAGLVAIFATAWLAIDYFDTRTANWSNEEMYAVYGVTLAGILGAWVLFFITGGTREEVRALVRDRMPKGLRKEHIRGMGLVDLTASKKPAWLKPGVVKPVALGWVPYPSVEAETLHTVIEGATGSGKTQAIKCLIAEALERGDSVIAVDGGHDLYNTFSGLCPNVSRLDVMDNKPLNGWSPFNEIERRSDWSQLAKGWLGDSTGESAVWNNMAKAFVSAVGAGYMEACKEAGRPMSNKELLDLITFAPAEAVAPFVVGTTAASLQDDKKLESVRMSALNPLKFWEYLPPDVNPNGFSLRRWTRETMKGPDRQRALFLTFKKRDLPTVQNLIASYIDLIISTAIDEGKSEKRIWLVIDELAGLGEIPSLLMGAAELRKTGLRLVVGMQDYDQIEDLYGKPRAASITNNLSNKLILRTTSGNSAERLSRTLGEARVAVWSENEGTSAKWLDAKTRSVSATKNEKDERVVMPSELLGLPDLTGFARIAGESTVYKTPIPIYAGTEDSPASIPLDAPGGGLVTKAK